MWVCFDAIVVLGLMRMCLVGLVAERERLHPVQTCGDGEGPVGVDYFFTKRRGHYVVFRRTDFLKAFLRHFVK